MLTLTKQNAFLAVAGIALFAVAMLFSFTSVAHATTYALEENGSYYSSSGSFFVDSSCGLRGACKWEYNEQWNDDRWLRWNFYSAHNFYNEHFHTTDSDNYVFIPTRGTTRSADYTVQTWRYTWPYAPYQNGTWYGYLNGLSQNSYLNSWVALADVVSDNTETYRIKLGDATGETTSWYTVVWDATKSVY